MAGASNGGRSQAPEEVGEEMKPDQVGCGPL